LLVGWESSPEHHYTETAIESPKSATILFVAVDYINLLLSEFGAPAIA